jgi:hypothetical protein
MDNLPYLGVFILRTSENNIRMVKSRNILYSWSASGMRERINA